MLRKDDLMEKYSLYTDFQNYINENYELLYRLESEESILDDFTSPIIKTLTYLYGKALEDEDTISKEDKQIFEFGFQFLFENIEQIKLYLKQLNNDFELLEKRSFYIKMIFNAEELKVEINKNTELSANEIKKDLEKLDEILNFFENLIDVEIEINDELLNAYMIAYNDICNKYDTIVLMSDAFILYCNTYGI
jgi:hypothetical protein